MDRPKRKESKKGHAGHPVAGSIGKDDHDRLAFLVDRNYASLREIADREITARNLARSVSPTSLVAETVVRLMRQRNMPRTAPHLCGLSTILMGQALADRARRARTVKRNPGRKPVPLPSDLQHDRRASLRMSPDPKTSVLRDQMLEALQALAVAHPREMEVLTLRLILEMPMDKVARLVGISSRTAYRDLNEGLLLLKRQIGWEAD